MTSATFLTPEQWKTLDQRIKHVDEDRWLSSRYAGKAERNRLIALYAFVYELARVRTVVSEPALGAIRFQWWRDALAEVGEGKPPRQHDVMLAILDSGLSHQALSILIDGYQDAFEAHDRSLEPEGEVMLAACRALDQQSAEAWTAEARRLGTVFAMARRLPPDHDHDVPHLEPVALPTPLRPGAAHGALARKYIAGEEPGRLTKRWTVMRAVMRGVA